MPQKLTRPVNEVLTRALCLAPLVARAVAEDFIGESSPGFDAYMGVEPEDAPSVIAKWVEREGLAQAFSPQERAYMLKEAGQWTRALALPNLESRTLFGRAAKRV